MKLHLKVYGGEGNRQYLASPSPISPHQPFQPVFQSQDTVRNRHSVGYENHFHVPIHIHEGLFRECDVPETCHTSIPFVQWPPSRFRSNLLVPQENHPSFPENPFHTVSRDIPFLLDEDAALTFLLPWDLRDISYQEVKMEIQRHDRRANV